MKDELTKKIAEVLREAAKAKAQSGCDDRERVISCQLADYPTTDMMVPPQSDRKGPSRHWPQGWDIFSWVAAIGLWSATFLPAAKSSRSDCSVKMYAVGGFTTTLDRGFWFPPSSNLRTGDMPVSPVPPIFNA